MSRLFQKIKGLYGKINIRHVSYERGGMRPKRDWNILLSLASIVLLILIFSSSYLYKGISKGSLFMVTKNNVDREVRINSSLLQKVVGDIKLREESFKNTKQNKGIPADPSL